MSKLQNRTILITGASRGIGREMALRFAADGANLVIAAKSAEANPKLPGTIYSVAAEVEQAGGNALPLMLDVRDDEQIESVIAKAAEHFGGIDAVINNAGAIKLVNSETLPMKRFDLIYQINTRAVLAMSKAALPWLKKSGKGHIINLSPPLNIDVHWFENFAPYTVTKYGMSMLTIGLAAEYKRYGIAVNSLWPQTLISTAAIEFEAGGKQAMSRGRHPRIMADAAYEILISENCELTGQCLIDEAILRERGVTEFEGYRFDPTNDKPLMPDLFL